MVGNAYRPGDIIYLGRGDGAKITLVPVQLVTLVSVSLDGELWKVRCPETGELYDHFIHYPDDEDDADRDTATSPLPA